MGVRLNCPDQHDILLLNAVDLLTDRWDQTRREVIATLRHISSRTGAEMDDVAALVVGSAHDPRMVGSL